MKVGVHSVAHDLKVTPRAIRHYEDTGLVHSDRDRRNHRRYDSEARARLAFITRMRTAGLSLEQIRDILGLQGVELDIDLAVEHLTRRRQELQRAHEAVDALMTTLLGERAEGGPATPASADA